MAEGQPAPTAPAAEPAAEPVAPTATWRDGLPDDLKGDKSLETIKDVPHLAKQYVEAQRYNVGALRMPTKDAKPEEWEAFHKKLGRPDSPEGYTIAQPVLPEGIEWDKDVETDFRGVAHRLGLTPSQAQGLVDFESRRIVGSLQARSTTAQVTIEGLKETYGGAYERSMEIAGRAVRHIGGDDLTNALNVTGAGNDPAIIKAFVKVGQLLIEDGAISGDVEGLVGPQDALRQAQEIMADLKSPYWTRSDPRHDETVKRVQELFELAYPKA